MADLNSTSKGSFVNYKPSRYFPMSFWASPFLLTAVACLILLVLRDVSGAISPPVRLEDATNMLSYYWKDSDPYKLFRIYAGYLSFGPNLVGYIAGNLPGILGMYFLHWVPLVMAACAFASIQLQNVEILGMSHREKACVAIALALVPMGNFALVTNTTYMLWSMLVMSTVLVLFWTPRASASAVVLLAFLALASMSHPLFILLLPILCIRVLFSSGRFERIGFTTVLLFAAGYILLTVDFSGAQKGARDGFITLAFDSFAMFFSRVVTEPLISSSLRLDFLSEGWIEGTVVFGLLVLIVFCVLVWCGKERFTRRQIWQIVLIFGVAGLFTAASAATGRAVLDSGLGQRYFFPSAFLVMMVLFWGLLQLFKVVPGKLRFLGYVLIVIWIIAINVADKNYYRSKNGDRIATYNVVSQAARLSRQEESYCVQNERKRWVIRLSERWENEDDCATLPL